MTHDLRQRIAQHLDVPESELEAFIPFSVVLDDDEEDLRFIVIKQIILFQVGYCNGSMSFGHYQIQNIPKDGCTRMKFPHVHHLLNLDHR